MASRVSGLPIAVTRAGARSVADDVGGTACDAVRPGSTGRRGARLARRPTGGGAVWARRGEVFAVHASGNAPGVHGLWPQALALGYRVAVRPSRREPFTGQRLMIALRESGFRAEDVAYLPTDYAGADEIIRAADLAMVYGGQDVVDKYAGDPTVWVNGPGRTKILITAEQDWRDHLDVIVDSICAPWRARRASTPPPCSTRAIPAPLAEAIADRLRDASLRCPPADERAVLPVHVRRGRARPSRDSCARRAAGTTPLLGADQVVADLGDGTAALRPRCTCWPRPIPTSSTPSWRSRASGCRRGRARTVCEPLRQSLVVTAITD